MCRKMIVFLSLFSALGSAAQEVRTPGEIPIEAFAQLPVMRDPELSPDGSHVAYFRPIEGREHLLIQPMDGSQGQALVIAPNEDSQFEWLHWANDNRLVYSISALRNRGIRDTTETRLWAIDKDGTNSVHIVKPTRTSRIGSNLPQDRPQAQLQDDVIHWLPDEPNHIMVALDGDQNGDYEVRKIDVRTGDFDLIRNDYPDIQDWLADNSGQLRIGWGYGNSEFKILRYGENGRWARGEKAAWRTLGYFPQAFLGSENVLLVRGRNEDGFAVMRTMDTSTGEFIETIFEKEGIDSGGLALDPVTKHPVGVHYVDDARRIEYFDKSLKSLQRAIDGVLPYTINEIVSLTADRRRVLIFSSSDLDPGTFSYLNRDEGKLDFVAEAMPGLLPELMSPVKAMSFAARDGLEIPAYLTVPRGVDAANLSLVVMPHGGPASRDSKEFWFLSQFLASRGYAVFQPNFRGSTGYGNTFRLAGRKEWGGKMQEDVTDGVLSLIEQGIANPDRICIAGWSYGGYSAAMGAVQTPDLYQCAASVNGVLDLFRLINDDRGYIGGSIWTQHMGLEGESAKQVSPYHQAERIQIPMLIIQAKDDARVNLDQGKRMERRLRRLKKPVEYVEVELGGHSMTNESSRTIVLQSLERFLNENIPAE